MTAVIGRPMQKGESVHHRNGIRLDNRPENLELRTGIHPIGQSISDMIAFCEDYLARYGHLRHSVVACESLEVATSATIGDL
jgi:hypothetical protein